MAYCVVAVVGGVSQSEPGKNCGTGQGGELHFAKKGGVTLFRRSV